MKKTGKEKPLVLRLTPGEAMQVELDAIDPPDLIEIINEAIDKYFDQDVYDGKRQLELEKCRKIISDKVKRVLKEAT